MNFFLDENKPTEVQSLASKESFGPKEEVKLQNLVLEGLREFSFGYTVALILVLIRFCRS